MEQKTFKTAEVVTACTGMMLCNSIGSVYDVLNFLTGESLFTHQLGRAMRELRPEFCRQVPALEAYGDLPNVNTDNWQQALQDIVDELGEEITLTKPEYTDYQTRDMLDELVDMVGPEKVIAVAV